MVLEMRAYCRQSQTCPAHKEEPLEVATTAHSEDEKEDAKDMQPSAPSQGGKGGLTLIYLSVTEAEKEEDEDAEDEEVSTGPTAVVGGYPTGETNNPWHNAAALGATATHGGSRGTAMARSAQPVEMKGSSAPSQL